MEHEKVKLPKFMCEWLEERQLASDYPITLIGNIDVIRKNNNEVKGWLACDKVNQWKLIDALRYGYEPEMEPRYYVDFGGDSRYRFLNLDTRSDEIKIDNKNQLANYKVKFTLPEIEAIDSRYKAFAVPVEEVEADE